MNLSRQYLLFAALVASISLFVVAQESPAAVVAALDARSDQMTEVAYYHAKRNHQGLENALIEADERVGGLDGNVRCRASSVLRCMKMKRPRSRNFTENRET